MENVYENKMSLEFLSKSENEAFARITVASFASQLDPSIEEISDIKTAVSEAVTNCIIHGYEEKIGTIHIECKLYQKTIEIVIMDKGKGILVRQKSLCLQQSQNLKDQAWALQLWKALWTS